jgi:hypothetical protein
MTLRHRRSFRTRSVPPTASEHAGGGAASGHQPEQPVTRYLGGPYDQALHSTGDFPTFIRHHLDGAGRSLMPVLITIAICEQHLANGCRTALGEEIDPPPSSTFSCPTVWVIGPRGVVRVQS